MKRIHFLTSLFILLVFSAGPVAFAADEAASKALKPMPKFTGIVSYDPDPEKIKKMLPLLKEKKLSLGINVRPNSDFDMIVEVARIVTDAGIHLLVLPDMTTGKVIWANTTNWKEYAAWNRKIMDFIEEKKLPITALVVDMETPIDSIHKLQREVTNGKDRFGAVTRFLTDHLEDPLFEPAREGYKAMVDETHARGFRIILTTLPFVLDDMSDGDPTLQRVLQCPVAGIDWDQIVFQAYSSLYRDISGTTEPEALSGFVYEYAKLAKEHFGERGALALGLIGDPNAPGMSSPTQLEADIRAAMAGGLGMHQLHLWPLEGLLNDPNPERWFDWDLTNPQPCKADATLEMFQTLLQSFDLANP